ncbi:UTP--glucose-1-phosphate uridylyltransferase [Hamiltosporidium tvaerminnensis]|uniref:UTP--glucose-1-phosphate uridylyltransferase n=2 Tax=Hamiltosporidium TaxID=1176354 RepID=A0A4Q9LJI5_9MICR|nr:UTP--glucose-1-phosphate uridylyltransferase [Hamiltosporidium tvaerminnensis]TBU08314.1 UTP--glucose-1-phosphate uridylyltransferase [Hamiltosporidium magnivora]
MENDDQHLIKSSLEYQERRKRILLERMKHEINILKSTKDYKATPGNLDQFYRLFERFLKIKDEKIRWDDIKPPPEDKIIMYNDLHDEDPNKSSKLLEKLAVLKLNGGLGTTMGCVGPKSAIKVRNGQNFLDLCVKQIDNLHKEHKVCVPLILMNSFNTEKSTNKMIFRYNGIRTFSQSIFPRISEDSLLPLCTSNADACFYPPGHGDLLQSLKDTGMLDELINEGKEYLFVSNIDNLAATVDFKILEHLIENDIDFLMEVTEKTRADIKGGTLVKYENSLRLLEIAQVPDEKKSEFTSVRKFKIFNTNSVWINLKTVKKVLDSGPLDLDIIVNRKKLPTSGETVIQLETAIGAAIKYFPKAAGMVVPRRRFLPVKTCSDLFLLQSNLFIEREGTLGVNPKRIYLQNPLVKLLGKNFKEVSSFMKSFLTIPDILELDHLTVSGNVRFGKNVVLKGTVIIIANENSSIQIPDGSILEDVIVTGNLPIIAH